jgi:hypothetical protein
MKNWANVPRMVRQKRELERQEAAAEKIREKDAKESEELKRRASSAEEGANG